MRRTVLLGEPPSAVADWLEQRRALGQDLFDEVWEGEYHVAPAAHRRHGDIGAQLAAMRWSGARHEGLWPSDPLTIGRPDDYRVCDRAFLRDREMAAFSPTAAIVVEVIAPGGESSAKFDFSFAHGVDEVLVVDPQRRLVEWFGRGDRGFERTGRSLLLELDEPTLHGEIDWPPL